MILSDIEIRKLALADPSFIKPYFPTAVQPSSIDLHLDCHFARLSHTMKPVDVAEPQKYEDTRAEIYTIPPLSMVLASTVERVRIPSTLVGRLEGKSSLARLGIFVHVTAGYFDPGFEGYCTLELFNALSTSVRVHAGMPIAQMAFQHVTLVGRPYGSSGLGSKYQRQPAGPTGSKYYQNFPDKIKEVQVAEL